jgi:hypothetical protein
MVLCRYSVNMQLVCDIDKRIVGFYVGCPGSCADSSVFKRMNVYKFPEAHFSPGEYLLADSAYGLTLQCIPAFKAPATNDPNNTEFNFYLAKSRVRIEHCIGMLKSRWASLTEMRQIIYGENEMKVLVEWTRSITSHPTQLGAAHY